MHKLCNAVEFYSAYFFRAPVSCQANCPVSCTHKTENDSIPEKPKEMKDEGTGEPVYDDSEEKEETPIEMDQRTSSAGKLLTFSYDKQK